MIQILTSLKRKLNPFDTLSFSEVRAKQLEEAMKEKNMANHHKKMAAFTEHMAEAKIKALIDWNQFKEPTWN